MAITTYSELQTAVTSYLDADNLAASVPDFIGLAENEFARVLRQPEQETRLILPTVAGNERVALPADFAGVKEIALLTDPVEALEGMSIDALYRNFGRSFTSRPRGYAIAGGDLWLGPAPDAAYDLQLVYWAKLTPLSVSAPSNWLLAAHPDLYLFGSLMQAEFYGWNDARLPLVKSRVDEIIMQMAMDGNRRTMPANFRIKHGVVRG
jgi:hypothetical protein